MTEQTEQTEGAQEEAVSEFAPAWRPKQGDVITGTLVSVEMIDPNGNGAYPCVTLLTTAGERNIHAFHTVLRRELARRRPKVGDELMITYLGQKDGGRNGKYHAYRVTGGQSVDLATLWDNELPPEERQSEDRWGSQEPEVPIPPAPVVPPAGEQFGDPPF